MRTTLDLDPQVLEAARQLASHSATSIGKVISELALKGLRATSAHEPLRSRNGFPIFGTGNDKPITLEDVKRALDDEGF